MLRLWRVGRANVPEEAQGRGLVLPQLPLAHRGDQHAPALHAALRGQLRGELLPPGQGRHVGQHGQGARHPQHGRRGQHAGPPPHLRRRAHGAAARGAAPRRQQDQHQRGQRGGLRGLLVRRQGGQGPRRRGHRPEAPGLEQEAAAEDFRGRDHHERGQPSGVAHKPPEELGPGDALRLQSGLGAAGRLHGPPPGLGLALRHRRHWAAQRQVPHPALHGAAHPPAAPRGEVQGGQEGAARPGAGGHPAEARGPEDGGGEGAEEDREEAAAAGAGEGGGQRRRGEVLPPRDPAAEEGGRRRHRLLLEGAGGHAHAHPALPDVQRRQPGGARGVLQAALVLRPPQGGRAFLRARLHAGGRPLWQHPPAGEAQGGPAPGRRRRRLGRARAERLRQRLEDVRRRARLHCRPGQPAAEDGRPRLPGGLRPAADEDGPEGLRARGPPGALRHLLPALGRGGQRHEQERHNRRGRAAYYQGPCRPGDDGHPLGGPPRGGQHRQRRPQPGEHVRVLLPDEVRREGRQEDDHLPRPEAPPALRASAVGARGESAPRRPELLPPREVRGRLRQPSGQGRGRRRQAALGVRLREAHVRGLQPRGGRLLAEHAAFPLDPGRWGRVREGRPRGQEKVQVRDLAPGDLHRGGPRGAAPGAE
mmetsp:Transcript_26092/g.77760  ORF Transcript_26092/g.77760 Transcript_26092/m.77760 type:complete len:647 (+) Transcript_26092:156-2096(+)